MQAYGVYPPAAYLSPYLHIFWTPAIPNPPLATQESWPAASLGNPADSLVTPTYSRAYRRQGAVNTTLLQLASMNTASTGSARSPELSSQNLGPFSEQIIKDIFRSSVARLLTLEKRLPQAAEKRWGGVRIWPLTLLSWQVHQQAIGRLWKSLCEQARLLDEHGGISFLVHNLQVLLKTLCGSKHLALGQYTSEDIQELGQFLLRKMERVTFPEYEIYLAHKIHYLGAVKQEMEQLLKEEGYGLFTALPWTLAKQLLHRELKVSAIFTALAQEPLADRAYLEILEELSERAFISRCMHDEFTAEAKEQRKQLILTYSGLDLQSEMMKFRELLKAEGRAEFVAVVRKIVVKLAGALATN